MVGGEVVARRGGGEGLVAEDVDVVAGVDVEDGEGSGVADGAVFVYTGHPFEDVEVAGVGGDGDEQVAPYFGGGAADDGFGEHGAAFDLAGGVGDVEPLEEFVHEADVVVPLGAEVFVGVVEVEHGEEAVVEACKVAGPDEFVFAFFAEVYAEGHVAVGVGGGEGSLDGEVGYFALAEEVEHLAGMGGAAEAGMGRDSGYGDDSVEHGGEVVDDLACFAFHGDVRYLYVGVLGFELRYGLCGVGNSGVAVALVFDIEEYEAFVEHFGQLCRMGDNGLAHGEVGEVGYDKLVFHRMIVMSPLRRFWRPVSHLMRQV